MKIYQCLRHCMKVKCWRFHIKTSFTFWDMRTWGMWKVCFQAFRNNRLCSKFAYFLRDLQTLQANNSRILRIKIAKFSGYYFYMNTNILEDFQICISVPLRSQPLRNIDSNRSFFEFSTAFLKSLFPLVSFYTPWKYPKTFDFLNVCRGYRKRSVAWTGSKGKAIGLN